ncbi:C2 family cysteine protease [Fontivita pretiosa]|uniref:C2 family cysteine protease n=1 Tax=Fontivita pretiosa TaxID=2989684 RepID=UPI003D16CA50
MSFKSKHRMRHGSPYSNSFRPIETLESRRMMSFGPIMAGTFSGSTGTIDPGTGPAPYIIDGTPYGDTIQINYSNHFATGPRLTVRRNAETAFLVILDNGQSVQINGLGGSDYIRFSGSLGVAITGGAGNDTILSGSGNDMIWGQDGNDTIDGGLGADMIMGGYGADTADYSTRTTPLRLAIDGLANDGAPGENDQIVSDIETLAGGSSNDYLNIGPAFSGNYWFYGNAGNDTILGGRGDDYILCGAGDDRVFGYDGIDLISGEDGNDSIRGGAGRDVICGGWGNDVLYADSGLDAIYGDEDDDKLYGGRDADYLSGGTGNDTIVSLGGGQSDTLMGSSGVDQLWLDAEATEVIYDAGADAPRNVHRVATFSDLYIGFDWVDHPSRELLGQKIWDPAVPSPGPMYVSFAGKPLFGPAGPHPDDIRQGGLGDCYWMAALGAVARTMPEVIRQTVVELGDGTFGVHFYKNGQNVFLRLDADLPAYGSSPAYAGLGHGDSMWIPILEKAWAFFRKGQGTYASIEGGWPEQTYWALGLSTQVNASTTFNSPQRMIEAINELLSRGDAVSFVTKQDSTTLVGLHVYMVSRVWTDASGTTWLTLRNPWGSDGTGGDGVEDGYVTLTAADAFKSYDQVAGGRLA